MEERFEVSPIRVRRDAGGSISVESGGRTVAIEDEPGAAPGKVPVPPPTRPPWRSKLMRRNELLLELQVEGDGVEEELAAALTKHGDADTLLIATASPALSRAELRPLLRLSRRHGIDVDVDLGADG